MAPLPAVTDRDVTVTLTDRALRICAELRPSIVMAASGRRAPELEYDTLLLLRPH